MRCAGGWRPWRSSASGAGAEPCRVSARCDCNLNARASASPWARSGAGRLRPSRAQGRANIQRPAVLEARHRRLDSDTALYPESAQFLLAGPAAPAWPVHATAPGRPQRPEPSLSQSTVIRLQFAYTQHSRSTRSRSARDNELYALVTVTKPPGFGTVTQ